MDEVEFYLLDLKSKFKKINPNEYYLSYSGGKDSHLLYWFIKEWLLKNDWEMWLDYRNIKIVGINTYMEWDQIRKRIYKNSDIVLLPELKPFEIKEKYGSPCFSKQQDQFIDRYQKGSRTESLMKRINGEEKQFSISKFAKEKLYDNKLHKISPKCCDFLKKKPAKKYEIKSKRKAILGVRATEGVLRKTQYTSCFNKNGKFTPLWDLEDAIFNKIYKKYNIETPDIYNYIDRTGCVGCPYGRQENVSNMMAFATPQRKKYNLKYFKESYDIRNFNYIQTNIFDFMDKE